MAGASEKPRSAASAPQRLNTTSVSEAVASQLRSRILDGDLVNGSELPPEAALLEQFPVSRPSLREAFRILETEGLLKVRRGKRGGTVITHPTPDTAAYHVGLLLHSRHIPMEDLAVARNLVEPLAAEQAARRRDHVKVGKRLAALNTQAGEQIEDELTFTRLSGEFHHELVMAAKNQTLEVLLGVLESVWNSQERNWAASAVTEGQYPSIDLRKKVLRAHERISSAIEAGDAEEAARLTRGHLQATSEYVSVEGSQVRILDAYGGRRQLGHY